MGFLQRLLGRAQPAAKAVDRSGVQQAAIELVDAGNACEDLGAVAEALQKYDAAVALAPEMGRPHLNRGNALLRLGQVDAALAAYQAALDRQPDYAAAHFNIGNIHRRMRRATPALAAYDAALAARPTFPECELARAVLLEDLGRLDDALDGYRRALELDGGFVHAMNNLGLLLTRRRRYRDAIEFFERALRLAPGYPYLLGNLYSARMHACDWTHHDADLQAIHEAVAKGARAVTPFVLVTASNDRRAQLRCAEIYVADKYPELATPCFDARRAANERIHVAYVSADFHSHATAALMAGLFETHDRSRFKVHAISLGRDDGSAMRERLVRAFEVFVDVGDRSDDDIAQLIADLRIDIAIDLKGFTAQARPGIFARRPAPVQVNYLGFPGTLGASYITHLIADAEVIPREHFDDYAETVHWTHCYQVNDRKRELAVDVGSRVDHGLPADAFVFCCFNNNYKITPQLFALWMRLLRDCDSAVLWLLHDNPDAEASLCDHAEAAGISRQRLVFAPRRDLPVHLARHRHADLFLDTLPYNAHTTASDALWAGLPLLTCTGTTFAGRVATSLLRAARLDELIVATLADYEALAVALYHDRGRLARIRGELALNRLSVPLFDTLKTCAELEAIYATMHASIPHPG